MIFSRFGDWSSVQLAIDLLLGKIGGDNVPGYNGLESLCSLWFVSLSRNSCIQQI